MGKIMSVVKFDSPAPGPDVITRKASEICGLAICYERDEHTLDELHEFSGKLYFESMPEEKIDVRAYRQNGAKGRWDETNKISTSDAAMKPLGDSDSGEFQMVYLDSYLGCELTLFHVTELALVKLGGSTRRNSGNLVEHDKVLTAEELQARFQAHREFHRKNRPLYVLYALFIFLSLPFHIIWAIVSAPFALLGLRRKTPKSFKNNGR